MKTVSNELKKDLIKVISYFPLKKDIISEPDLQVQNIMQLILNNQFNNPIYESNNLTIFIEKHYANSSKYFKKEFNIKTKLDIVIDFCGA